MSLALPVESIVQRSVVLQVGVVIGFWLIGELLVRACALPLPGGVIGLICLLVLLGTRRVDESNVRRGAQWLLAEMLLFFVPAVLAVLDHREFLGLVGVKVLFVILCSTAAVMCVTALVVDRCHRWSVNRVRAAREYR